MVQTIAMSLADLTRTAIVLDADESLLVGLTPLQAETQRRLAVRVAPAKGGLVYRRRVYTHPLQLHTALTSIAVGYGLKARTLRGTATGRYYEDRAEFMIAAARLILRRDFLQRYWPHLADEIDEVHEQVKRQGKRGVALEGVAWAA